MTNRYAASIMPERAPLEMAPQTFARVGKAREMSKPGGRGAMLWRIAAFVPTLLLTGLLCYSITGYLAYGGVAPIEAVVLALVALTFVWLAFSVTNACLGLIRIAFVRSQACDPPRRDNPQDIALLIPVYNESPSDVFGNAAAMLKELSALGDQDRYTLFILSDTRVESLAAQEERAFAVLRSEASADVQVFYRRRAENTDKKVGNISDWIENWGASYEAMVVLDADSLMSGVAIGELVEALACDPDAGLIQSRPMLIGAQTLFGRVQQFSNAVYGWLTAEGLATWSQEEGNYWGHNAIIRTRAFAESARLPYLRGRKGKQRLILSHDFVEAGMLRRAGWSVRLLPRMDGSYEEAPQTLIDFALRDRRWCHGNMQHLRLLATRGFHMITRIHLLQGALAFLMSPAWLAVVILWSFVSISTKTPESYFSVANPLRPFWPEQQQDAAWIYMLFVYGMLLFPKFVSALYVGLRHRTRSVYGSGGVYVGSILVELVLSVLYAPIMMVQHTVATVYAVLGRSPSWSPQNRGATGRSWLETLRFHWIETVLGLALLAGIVFANVSMLILPIAFSLAAAVPLSLLSATPVTRIAPRVFRLETPHTLSEPNIIQAARQERAWMKAALAEAPQSQSIAAE